MPEPSPTALEAPTLLVAMPQVLDPFFHKSVVLLIHQDDQEGSFGVIVNRRTGIKVSEILRGLEIGWQGDDESLAYFGGPVQPQLGSVLFARPAATEDGEEGGADGDGPAAEGLSAATEVAPGLAVTHHVGDLRALAERPPEHVRLYLGYAGWGAGQLMQEILRDDWLLAPVAEELIFAPDPETVWEQALRSVGVDPGSLPSWSAGGGGEEAN